MIRGMTIGPVRHQKFFWQLIALALVWFPAPSVSAEALLRWKFTAGESLSYRFTQKTQTETAGTGKSMRIAMDTGMIVTWKIDSVGGDGVATITQTIDKFTVSMKTDKLDPISYDSKSKTSPSGPAREIADAVGKLIGAPCQIQMTERGEISSVDPSKPLQQALESATKKSTGDSTTSASISAILRQAAVVLPEKPISDGTSWETQQEVSTPSGKVLQRSQFTYAGLAEYSGAMHDKLTVQATFKLAPDTEKTSPLKIKEGEQTGTLWFDSKEGRLLSSDLTQKLATERPYRDMMIRVQSSSSLKIELIP